MPAPSNRRPALRVRLAGAAAIAALAIGVLAGPAAAALPSGSLLTPTPVVTDGTTVTTVPTITKTANGRRW